MCFGGGGGGQTANTVSKFEPPEWLVPGWKQTVTTAAQLASQPYMPYDGMRVAPMNGYQTQGLNFMEDRALNGATDLNSARGAMTDTTNGAYLMKGPQANITPGVNAYAGSNPYLEALIKNNATTMSDAFARGTAAQTDAAFAGDEAFGGSAYADQVKQNNATLAKQVSDMDSQMRFNDYTTQQGLAENAINRGMSAQQFNATSAQSAWDNERNRMLQAAGTTGQLCRRSRGV
jgi:hypothetical protein